jgi:hypothetical protein
MLRQREPRIEIPKILRAAEGEACTIQHPTYCNGRTDTTVAAHYNWLDGGKGMGKKCDDLAISFACSGCHYWLDETRDDARRYYWMRGHLKTLRRLWERGVIS